jgi:hypothetical protein
MVILYPFSWLANIAAGGALIIVGAIEFFATRRMGWSAWPILLLATLLVPVLVFVALMVALYYVGETYGWAAAIVLHVNGLIILVPVSTIVGTGLGLTLRKRLGKGG